VLRFSVESYFELARLGFLGENESCELLEGWIVPQTNKSPLHGNTVDILLGLLTLLVPTGWLVRRESVLQTETSAPEPDFALVRGKRGRFPDRHPQGSDVGLVIEVADSSLAVDRRKAEIYAAAGVPEYWIVNLQDRCVEVYGAPSPQAGGKFAYAPSRIMKGQDSLNLVLDDELVGHLRCRDVLPE
jgi:Uma2 family endonuclease